ncbi:hypothetical protein F4804DRAFT_308457 [Jackrogersella minutella]|nr:hypothetical protein F4804DRAFT_308457 [Jackrogersella minutella]
MESTTTITNAPGLLTLPRDILVMLPNYLHNIEDYMNVASTCRDLRDCMSMAQPHTILCLAWESSRGFFRPSPLFLVCATARQLGDWARESDANEAELAAGMPCGTGHLMDLALREKQIGLNMEDIRELYKLRFSVINPVADIVDQCVGEQWYATPNFWNGGVDDAYTIDADPDETLFHLASYGELFGSDFEPFLDPSLSNRRRLKVETRLEFVKYCIPDFATECFKSARGITLSDGTLDPRRALVIHDDGPYAPDEKGNRARNCDNSLALEWTMKSTRWRPRWKQARLDAGADPDFADELAYDEGTEEGSHWKQNMLEIMMQCQGLKGLGMILPGTDLAESYKPKIREWREKIQHIEEMPKLTKVGRWVTHEYPDLWHDLHICTSGYVAGT